jgi:hypothetical protein
LVLDTALVAGWAARLKAYQWHGKASQADLIKGLHQLHCWAEKASQRQGPSVQRSHPGGFPGDERHLVFECLALQSIRDRYPGVFGADIVTMQQFMWQLDIVGVAHFVMDCFDYLDAASPSNQP